MSPKPVSNSSAHKASRDLDRLVKQAAARPGVAEVMRLSREYQRRLEEVAKRTGRLGRLVMTTTDSTA